MTAGEIQSILIRIKFKEWEKTESRKFFVRNKIIDCFRYPAVFSLTVAQLKSTREKLHDRE